MKLNEQLNFIEWLKKILLAFEDFFHQFQAWLAGEDEDSQWPARILTKTDADE